MFEVVKNKLCTERSKFAKDGRLKWAEGGYHDKNYCGCCCKIQFSGLGFFVVRCSCHLNGVCHCVFNIPSRKVCVPFVLLSLCSLVRFHTVYGLLFPSSTLATFFCKELPFAYLFAKKNGVVWCPTSGKRRNKRTHHNSSCGRTPQCHSGLLSWFGRQRRGIL